MNNMKEYIDALKNGKGYDWISNNGWKLNKDDLNSAVDFRDENAVEKTVADLTNEKMRVKQSNVYDKESYSISEFKKK